MARKREDLLDDLDQLGNEAQQAPASTTSTSKATKTVTKTITVTDDAEGDDGEDAFAEIQKQLAARPTAASSRPGTPRLNSNTTSTTTNRSPKRAEFTPASTSVGSSQRTSSEDRVRSSTAHARASGDGRSFHQGFTPGNDEEAPSTSVPSAKAAASNAGGWFGSVFSVATAAVKQAESLAKELRSNEEAQRWADQVRGNLHNLQTFGTDLRTRALPTFTSLMSHIAPPISAHERLQIHTTHDIQNYPSLDPLIYSTFSRIMAQVEGGDLLVIQRGSESRNRAHSDSQGYKGGILGGTTHGTWADSPWWEEKDVQRSLGSVSGLKEGTRLVRVSAESYAKEIFDLRGGGLEEALKRATESLSESNPVRSSDIFLAVQAISYTLDKDLFADDAHAEKPSAPDIVVGEPASAAEDVLVFAIYLYDPVHGISLRTLSQSFPQRWANWIDADTSESSAGLPDSILEIIEAGGVDPREWVAEWMEEALSLAVGIVAQKYVAKRMGVGEGGFARGKRRAEEDGVAGEAARAL